MRKYWSKTKTCRKCKTEKASSQFEKNTSWHCNECRAKQKKNEKARAKNRTRPRKIRPEKPQIHKSFNTPEDVAERRRVREEDGRREEERRRKASNQQKRQRYHENKHKKPPHYNHKQLKELVKEAKTPCVVCGWFGYLSAIDFHHVYPAQKSFVISAARSSYSKEKVDTELAKCVCLCANCHRGVHSGDLELKKYINVEDYHIKQ